MTRMHWIAASLAAITGAIHLYLYATQAFLPFLFAGAVFFAAVGAMLVIPYGHLARRVLYAIGVPFTAGQIGLWVLAGTPDFALGVADKAVQIALIVALIYLFRMEMRDPTPR